MTLSCPTCRALGAVFAEMRQYDPPVTMTEVDDRVVSLVDEDLASRVLRMEGHRRAYAQAPVGTETLEEEQHRLGIAEGLRMAIDALRLGTAIPDPAPPAKRAPPKEKTSVLDGVVPKTTSLNGTLGRCELAILAVLARRRGRPTTSVQVGILAGYSPTSGGFNAALATLRAEGLIDGLIITADGVKRAGAVDPLPTGMDLVRYWQSKLDKAEAAMLGALVAHHPKAMRKEQLGERTGYSPTSGGFNAALAKLRALELINRGGEIRPADVFFEGGR